MTTPRYHVYPHGVRSSPLTRADLWHLLYKGAITPGMGAAPAADDLEYGNTGVENVLKEESNDDYLEILNHGVQTWNYWRQHATDQYRFLSGAHLNEAALAGINLSNFDLNYSWFLDANLSNADFSGSSLRRSNLAGANLENAKFIGTDLMGANLTGANLRGAELIDCDVYGTSVWDVDLSESTQAGLNICDLDGPSITVDNLKVAQFIYLLLNNSEIRNVIDTLTSKLVLILGRFTQERKSILDQIKARLYQYNYTPIIFDFEKPTTRDTIETMSTLAHMSRFVVVDLTDAKSVLQELQSIAPILPSVPIQPIILSTQALPPMFDHTMQFRNVLKPFRYKSVEDLLLKLSIRVIEPAEQKAARIQSVARSKT